MSGNSGMVAQLPDDLLWLVADWLGAWRQLAAVSRALRERMAPRACVLRAHDPPPACGVRDVLYLARIGEDGPRAAAEGGSPTQPQQWSVRRLAVWLTQPPDAACGGGGAALLPLCSHPLRGLWLSARLVSLQLRAPRVLVPSVHWVRLADALRALDALESLDLDLAGCRRSDHWVVATTRSLWNALPRHLERVRLRLRDNHLGGDAARVLCRALAAAPRLRELDLDLSRNHGRLGILHALHHHLLAPPPRTLRCLSLGLAGLRAVEQHDAADLCTALLEPPSASSADRAVAAWDHLRVDLADNHRAVVRRWLARLSQFTQPPAWPRAALHLGLGGALAFGYDDPTTLLHGVSCLCHGLSRGGPPVVHLGLDGLCRLDLTDALRPLVRAAPTSELSLALGPTLRPARYCALLLLAAADGPPRCSRLSVDLRGSRLAPAALDSLARLCTHAAAGPCEIQLRGVPAAALLARVAARCTADSAPPGRRRRLGLWSSEDPDPSRDILAAGWPSTAPAVVLHPIGDGPPSHPRPQ